MMGKTLGLVPLMAVALTLACCRNNHTSQETDDADTLEIADSLDRDSAFFFQDEDQGLSLKEQPSEMFGDFIFAFTHNTRFQAERIRFPLLVREMDGSERRIKSGKQFRSEFQLPGNDYYTLLLGDLSQMEILQNDSALQHIAMQKIDLETQTMTSYAFDRSEGRWYLSSSTHSAVDSAVSNFLHFYSRFTTDSLYQQESVAQSLKYTIEEPDEVEEEMEGTIDREQWPAFRPEMPAKAFVNINFEQHYPNPNCIHLLQCGISNGMLDIFTFHQEGDNWKLVSYEN